MKRLAVCMVVIGLSLGAWAQTASGGGEQDLRSLISQFLTGAGNNDILMFQRFFADDVIYTRNSGQTTTKAAILKSLSQPRKPGATAEPPTHYSADEMVVHDYGNTAVVNFVLVAREANGKVTNYRDTGTFLKRNGHWQAVAWQATKITAGEK